MIPLLLLAAAASASTISDGGSTIMRMASVAGVQAPVAPPAADPMAKIQRSSCVNDRVTVNARTGRRTTSREESLETALSWRVRGKEYTLTYYYQKASGNQPVPHLSQLVSKDQPAQGGMLSSNEGRVLILTGNFRVEDFTVRREAFLERDANGGRIYAWANGARGELINSSTQDRRPDGSAVVVTQTHTQQVTGGFRDGGSVNTCTIRPLSRDAWLVLADDPSVAAEISGLDTLALHAHQAEQTGTQAAVDVQERAFLAAWNALYEGRKAAVERRAAQVRAAQARRRQQARDSGIAAALEAVERARQDSHRNEVIRELRELREELERRRR